MKEKEERKQNNSKGVFYAVVGIATLIVAIIGATFAYFTASANAGNNVISGNMASIGFDLQVEKVLDPSSGRGMIPMSNSMIEPAINDTTNPINNTCTDDNGNAVCQIYKITVTNNSTAAMFVDGYVALAGGSGIPTDFTSSVKNKTTMRWAQVFKQGGGNDATSHYSTAGTQYLAINTEEGTVSINSLDAPTANDTTGFNSSNILTSTGIITANATVISGSRYDAVGKNYIRVSEHQLTANNLIDTGSDFTRTSDLTSLLVINQQLGAVGTANNRNQAIYYFVVWLAENGHNQTPTQSTTNPQTTTNPAANNFFNGVVKFVSAQGSEVTATFSDYTAVRSDHAATTNP
ncbi:MAG: hypothetical protein IKF19_05775 [Bacilli bacterium]|nr:hypothetical protein [Bacilli bacterium]